MLSHSIKHCFFDVIHWLSSDLTCGDLLTDVMPYTPCDQFSLIHICVYFEYMHWCLPLCTADPPSGHICITSQGLYANMTKQMPTRKWCKQWAKETNRSNLIAWGKLQNLARNPRLLIGERFLVHPKYFTRKQSRQVLGFSGDWENCAQVDRDGRYQALEEFASVSSGFAKLDPPSKETPGTPPHGAVRRMWRRRVAM